MADLRLMIAMAHPDDETLGVGGTVARYAGDGAEVSLVTATRGEKGWFGAPDEYPGPEKLGKIREAELDGAARVLGMSSVQLLDYTDGELDEADYGEAIRQLANAIRKNRPQVVVTFGQDGVYGHPDHIAMCQFVSAAIPLAAGETASLDGEPHQVSKLYYFAPSAEFFEAYEAAFGELVMTIDGTERRSVGWKDWAVTTRIDTRKYAQQVWNAVRQHRSQLIGYEKLLALSDEYHEALWGNQQFYRVFSLVNGGRKVETDLFAGLR